MLLSSPKKKESHAFFNDFLHYDMTFYVYNSIVNAACFEYYVTLTILML